MEEDDKKDSPPADQDQRQGAPAPAETMTPYHFSANYRLRQSFVVLAFRLVALQFVFAMIIWGVYGVLQLLDANNGLLFTAIFWVLQLVNLIFVFFFTSSWYNHYYVISPKEVLKFCGLFIRRTATCDLTAVQSVQVQQNVIQRLFNYGTLQLQLELGNSDPDKNFLITKIHRPYDHAQMIDAERLKGVGEGG